MKCYKGFNSKLQCQPDKIKAPFQFEVGKTYVEDKASLCHSGFHACENPMDVFAYYTPADSRYCIVDLDDVSGKRQSNDSKVCGKKIHIEAEIGLKGIVEAGVKFIMDKVNFDSAPATNTGYRSVATNTGDGSAATNTGYRSAATNTGYCSAATNTGDGSAATNTGYCSAATVKGKESVAVSVGYKGKARGNIGSWIVLAEWEKHEDGGLHRTDVKCIQVDGEKIKADTFYSLKNGEFVEVE